MFALPDRRVAYWLRRALPSGDDEIYLSAVLVKFLMIVDRPTLSRAEARSVYDGFAVKGHAGGRDASSGYGGPAVQALLAMAAFADARSVDR